MAFALGAGVFATTARGTSIQIVRAIARGIRAAELAAILRVVERPRAVHGGAIVPDHEIADAPGVAIDELRLGRVLRQIAKEQSPLRDRPVDDARLVRREIERAPARARDRADQ